MDDVYCGIGNIPKKSRRGNMAECAEKGQIRYYGIKKIDSVTLNSIKDKKNNNEDTLLIKIFNLDLKAKKLAKEYKAIDDKEKKKKLKDKIDDFSAKIKELKRKQKSIINLKKKTTKAKPIKAKPTKAKVTVKRKK